MGAMLTEGVCWNAGNSGLRHGSWLLSLGFLFVFCYVYVLPPGIMLRTTQDGQQNYLGADSLRKA